VRNLSVISYAEETPGPKGSEFKIPRKFLHRLLDSSEDLFTHLCSEPTPETLDAWQEMLEAVEAAFFGYRDHYEADKEAFINPSYVLSVLGFTHDDQPTPLMSDATKVVSAANLALFMMQIQNLEEGNLGQLQKWDTDFAHFFVPEDMLAAEGDDKVTDAVLQIRLQTLIYNLERASEDPGLDPYQILADIFCDNEQSLDELMVFAASDYGNQSLKLKPSGHLDFNKDAKLSERVTALIGAILGFLKDPKDGLSALKEHFSWDESIAILKHFAIDWWQVINRALKTEPLYPATPEPNSHPSRVDSQIPGRLQSDPTGHARLVSLSSC
jgi:hypothetical protein